MKRVPLLLFLVCLFPAAKAQRNVQNLRILENKCQPYYLTPVYSYKEKKKQASSPIKYLEVVDFRPDTGRVGFIRESRTWKDMRFRAGLQQEFHTYLNEVYAHSTGSQSLLIVIKKCWFFDTVVARPTLESKKAGKGRVVFRAEAFLKTEEGYTPYTYLDTVVKATVGIKAMAIWRIPLLLEAFMNKVLAVQEAAVLRNRSYTLEALDSLNKKRFIYPMDTASTLRKGVYASIEEFRNNQPSIHNYEVIQNSEGHLDLFLKDEAGESYFSRKMWGYCDGEHCYTMMDGNLFPVLQVDHAFYVFGSREYKLVKTKVPLFAVLPAAYLFALEPVAEKAVRKLSLFQLDVHTGLID